MRTKPEQLQSLLQKTIAPIYFVSGDEPLQSAEASDAIRAAVKKAGFTVREILLVDHGFNWKQLAITASEQSIFSDKKLIELRISGNGPGVDGAKALVNYCQHRPDDTVLMITCGKLANASLKSTWFQAIDNNGIIIQIWPIDGSALLIWIQQRLQLRGLRADADGIKLIASRIEGNLLAAAQEIEKLYVLYGSGVIGYQQIIDAVSDSSRYDVFDVVTAVLDADIGRSFKIINGLRDEGIAAPVILWALTREARSLIKIKWQLSLGQNRELVFKNNQIWDKRKAQVQAALKRLSVNDLNAILTLAAVADREIKGQQKGDAWETLQCICLRFSAIQVV